MALIYLVEIIAAVDTSGTLVVLRYSTGKGYAHPSAPGFYDPRVQQAANITRDVVQDGKTFGESQVSYGEMTLANPDGALDALLGYGYGRSAKLLLGDENDLYSSFTTVLSGTIDQPTADFTSITLRFRDRQTELDVPVQSTLFGGTNVGPTGIDGTANDIAGKQMPRLWGVVKQITPYPLNTSTLIYGVNYDASGNPAAVASFDAIYDGGVVLSAGSDYANLAALQAASISSGYYATCLAQGLFRLGSSAARSITCDVTENATLSNNYAGTIMERLLLDAGVASADINASDISILASDAPYVAGYYAEGSVTYRTILDALATSIGGWYSPDSLGQYRIKQLKAPSGTPLITLKTLKFGQVLGANEGDIVSIERLVTSDDGRGIPAWLVTLNYQKVWTVQDASSLATSVTDAEVAFLSQEYRTAMAENLTVQNQFLQAVELDFDSLLNNQSDAQTECTRRGGLYAVLRDYYQVVVKLDAAIAANIDLGALVQLQFPRFGLDAGKLFTVIGLLYDAEGNALTLKLWG